MIESFFPKLILQRVQDINTELLKSKGISGLILDIDNTLAPDKGQADQAVISWIEKIKSEGIKLCIVSNASEKRVIKFNERIKINAIHRASKPSTKALIKAIEIMELDNSQVAMVGDQIFTDIYGGNRLGIYTILVRPIDKKEIAFVRLKRIAERYVLSRYGKVLNNKR